MTVAIQYFNRDMTSKSSYSDAAVIALRGYIFSVLKVCSYAIHPSSSRIPHKNGNKKDGNPFKN